MEGEVTLIFIDEGEQAKAKISLPTEHYLVAVDAHKENGYVRVVGDYKPSNWIGKISNHSSFEREGQE